LVNEETNLTRTTAADAEAIEIAVDAVHASRAEQRSGR
jgi:hypothetical protein